MSAPRSRAVGVTLALVVAACSAPRSPPVAVPAGGGAVVRVAAFDFAESRLLAELYAQTLERGGVAVERVTGLASREVVEPALEAGLVDLVPEYAGTLLTFLSDGRAASGTDLGPTLDALDEHLARRGLRRLAAAPAANSNGVVVTAETARRLGLRAISDLAPLASRLRFGGPPECPERPLCLRGLRDVYGLSFADFVPLDVSGPLTVAALVGEEVDVAMLFTTSALAASADLVHLVDDRGLQPAENVVPVLRREVVARIGAEGVARLDALSATLTTAALADLVARVEVAGADVAAAASTWIDRQALTADAGPS